MKNLLLISLLFFASHHAKAVITDTLYYSGDTVKLAIPEQTTGFVIYTSFDEGGVVKFIPLYRCIALLPSQASGSVQIQKDSDGVAITFKRQVHKDYLVEVLYNKTVVKKMFIPMTMSYMEDSDAKVFCPQSVAIDVYSPEGRYIGRIVVPMDDFLEEDYTIFLTKIHDQKLPAGMYIGKPHAVGDPESGTINEVYNFASPFKFYLE